MQVWEVGDLFMFVYVDEMNGLAPLKQAYGPLTGVTGVITDLTISGAWFTYKQQRYFAAFEEMEKIKEVPM